MEWNQAKLQAYIDNNIEESLTLDYKAAAALTISDGKRKEITKDVSAMANSDGGVIIYGLAEFQEPAKEHRAAIIDPVDRTAISKEWLEQVINNIRPRINNLFIKPVPLSSGEHHVAYVIEIPKGTTAHQALDHRYYKRFNFLSQPMEDYEIRDIMNRLTTPDAEVEFDYEKNIVSGKQHHYKLVVKIRNLGSLVINHFQLSFTFPQFNNNVNHIINSRPHIDCFQSGASTLFIRYRSNKVLFPEEEIDISDEMAIRYEATFDVYTQYEGKNINVDWTLYADNMAPKKGSIPFEEKFQCF